MNENVQVRLEIAKAAISARIKKADAQEWLDWVLVGNTVTDLCSLNPIALSDQFLVDKIQEGKDDYSCYPSISSKYAKDLVIGLKYAKVLSMDQVIGIAQLFGIKKPMDIIKDAFRENADEDDDAGIAGTYSSYDGFSFNKKSFLRWVRRQGTVTMKAYPVCCMVDDALKEVGLIYDQPVRDSSETVVSE